jgi:hypothetical protein
MKNENLKFTLLGILGCTMIIASIIEVFRADSDFICCVVAFILSTIVTMVAIMSLEK